MKILIAFLFFISAAQAKPSDFSKYFEIDLTASLPMYDDLYQQYVVEDPTHDRKYQFNFSIGNTFDKIFAQTIKIHGTSEKRLKTENEDELIEMLNSVPKETWQYIGPYLHTVAGISEKVLNMPGIKETKNRFPTRIAPQLQHIKNLEFLSPHMYYILMPEIWPEYNETQEIVIKSKEPSYPKTLYNPQYYKALSTLVPRDFFANKDAAPKNYLEDLRTTNIQPNSPLTSGDVKAFVATIPKINEYANQGQKEKLLKINSAGNLLNIYEAQNGTALPINDLKGVVNPCQREVQKIIVAGLYQEFLSVVGPMGFTPETLAVTCDKTIKAYRLATMSLDTKKALTSYKYGIYDNYLKNKLNPKNQGLQFSVIESIIQMHKAPLKDVLSVKKHIPDIKDAFLKSDSMILSSPIAN